MDKSKLNLFSLAAQESKLDNGRTVYLKRLTALERINWFERMTAKLDSANESEKRTLATSVDDAAALLVTSLVDGKGKRLFEDNEIELVKQIDAQTVDRLASEILVLNGMTSGSKEDVKKK